MRQLFMLLLLVCLTGCGFRLRGSGSISPLSPKLKKIYIHSTTPYSALQKELKSYLTSMGAMIMPNKKSASVTLDLISEQKTQSLLSVSGSQNTREYQLKYTVAFQLIYPNGNVIVPPQSAVQLRTITIESSQLLGNTAEMQTLYQEMQHDVIAGMIDRLSSNNVRHLLSQHHHKATAHHR
jgi:LPS-assembly lipoprotein